MKKPSTTIPTMDRLRAAVDRMAADVRIVQKAMKRRHAGRKIRP